LTGELAQELANGRLHLAGIAVPVPPVPRERFIDESNELDR
jgi:hypothetical protein